MPDFTPKVENCPVFAAIGRELIPFGRSPAGTMTAAKQRCQKAFVDAVIGISDGGRMP
jgi:hypothetical protein